jgi:hypothetical protein
MSCLPNLLAETLESKIKNISRDIVANVRNTNDLDNLLENLHKNEKMISKLAYNYNYKERDRF